MLLGDAISIYWTQTPKDEGIEIYLLDVESIPCPLLVVQTFWMLLENCQHLEKDTLILLQKNEKETHGQIFGRVQLFSINISGSNLLGCVIAGSTKPKLYSSS